MDGLRMNRNIPDFVHELFAAHDLRCTRQRRAIYEALCRSISHPTADELYQDVVPVVDGLSLATVYNTLEVLCNVGLAHKLPGTNGSAQYDDNTEHHLHVRCEQSGEVRDVPDELGNKLLDRIPQEVLDGIESSMGFKINQVQIELVGEHRPESRGQRSRIR